jgi:hypothetical protein
VPEEDRVPAAPDEDHAGAVTRVLDTLEAASADGPATLTVGEIVERMGTRSFAPLLLVPALVMVSPVSTIPGTPTLSALLIGLVAVQALLGRRQLWLPGILRRRRIPAARLERAVAFLRRPVGWVEPIMRPRLGILAVPPGSHVALLVCLAITIVMPIMEFLPIVASVAATAIALIAAGLLARDGVLVAAGYGVASIGFLIARSLAAGAQQL